MDKQEAGTLDKIFRNYAMTYFSLHATQRLQAFEFYVTLSTAVIGGYVVLLRYSQSHKWVSILGFVLAFLSFVFWKLDGRTRALVKNGEDALKFLDAQHGLADVDGAPHPLRIFTRDDYFTKEAHWLPLSSGYFSYTRCFRWVFVGFAVLGIGAGLASLVIFPT